MENPTTSLPTKSEPEAPPSIIEGSDPFGALPDYGASPFVVPTEKAKLTGRPRKGETKEQARARRAVEHFKRKATGGAPAPDSASPRDPVLPLPPPETGAPALPLVGDTTAKKPPNPKALREARKHMSRAIVAATDGAVVKLASKRGLTGMGASEPEMAALCDAWEMYLESQEIEVSPGWVLIATTVGVYGPKLAAASQGGKS